LGNIDSRWAEDGNKDINESSTGIKETSTILLYQHFMNLYIVLIILNLVIFDDSELYQI